jgi:hypothetical protein
MEHEDRIEDDITPVEVVAIAVATAAAIYGALCIVRKTVDIAENAYNRNRALRLMKKAAK